MKLSGLLLGGSLVANVVLLAWVIFPSGRDSSGPANSADPASPSGSASRVSSASAMKHTGSADSAAASAAQPTWDQLRTDDLDVLVPRLRAAGFPPRVLTSIIQMLLWDRFSARRAELQKGELAAPYWAQPTYAYNDPKIAPELRKLDREMNDTFERLLGSRSSALQADSPEGRAYLHLQYGEIPFDKIDRIQAIQRDYSDLRSQLNNGGYSGVMLPADREKMTALDQAMRADIAAALSPSELFEYNLHASPTAMSLRYNTLNAFPATEAEYRAMFPLFQARDEPFAGIYGNYTPEQQAARRDADELLKNQMKSVLTPDRYADYELASSNVQLARLLNRLDLPLSTATQLNTIQSDIQQRAGRVRNNSGLDPMSRDSQLAALTAEAATKVTAAIGPRGYEAYRSQYGGTWINRLQSRATPK